MAGGGSFEKSVKGGTKVKLAAPKAKYVEHVLIATHAGPAGVAEIFRALQTRLRDPAWTVVFKALILVHIMVREGEPNITLKFVAESPSKLAISHLADGTLKEYTMTSGRSSTEIQIQGTNIRHYYTYLLARAKAFRDTKVDWVRDGGGRLKRQSVEKGLLRETESVQGQIKTLLECNMLSADAENDITVCAFRLLTMDLLVLYGVMNEGTINVLEHYFEMSKVDAKRALAIYKTFAKQTNVVVEFLSTARQYEGATRLEIPKLKHAPTSLTASLEEYLNDPEFESNRRQYIDSKGGKSRLSPKKPLNKAAVPTTAPQRAPAPDLIDFFDSIEQYKQPAQQAPNPFAMPNPQTFPQPNTFQPQVFDALPFATDQGAYVNSMSAPMNPPPSNPFRQSMMPPNLTGPNSSNPFARQMTGSPFLQPAPAQLPPQNMGMPFSQPQPPQPPLQNTGMPFSQPQTQQPSQQNRDTSFAPPLFAAPPQQIMPQSTGTNPFARQQTGVQSLSAQQTGSNPFRQSAFVNSQTGQGWQASQGTMGGLEQAPTMPIFPRPGQPAMVQSPQNPWG